MLAAERKNAIRDIVLAEGSVDLSSLGTRFGVSEDTIRRDLRDLDAAGLIRRVRGGALRRSPVPMEFAGREPLDNPAKFVIGVEGASYVQPGMVVGIDNGTSTLACVRAIPQSVPFTAITTSLPVAIELGDRSNVHVVIPGGSILGSARSVVGAAACRELSRFRFDLTLIGACGVDAEAGLTAIDFEEIETKRILAENADRRVILTTSNKLGVVETSRFAPLRDSDVVIVDACAPSDELDALRKLVQVTVCQQPDMSAAST